jgi:2-aminobenzoate-CoA ligase
MSSHLSDLKSTQQDRFVHERMPASESMPEFVFPAQGFEVPPGLNLVVELLDRHVANGHGAAPCLRDPQQTLSYGQVLDRVNQGMQVLQKHWGLVPGNRVLLRGANSIDMAIAWLAVVKAGLVCVATMPLLRAAELTVITLKAQVQHALCADALWDELAATQAQVPELQHAMRFSEFNRLSAIESTDCTAPKTEAGDIGLLAFTSGTTGQPKAAIHTHRDMWLACLAWPQHVLRQTASDVVMGSPPLAFTFGCGGLLLFPMSVGASVYFHDKPYTPETFVHTVNAIGATVCYTAPTMYRQLAPFAKAQGVPSLRASVSAGEGLPDATRTLWREATGLEMVDGIGATEMFHIFISSAGEKVRRGAIGQVVPGYEAKVVNDAGEALPTGQIGKLAVRGVTGCKYLDDARQAKYVQAGWNYPGDAFFQDAEGYFFYQARDDDMIITSGYNVGGPEVEDAVLKHPAAAECGVIGVPDEERGMLIKAFVVLRPGQAADAAQVKSIQDHVKATIAPYKYPRDVVFLDKLPRTETGKLQRFKLRAI